MTLVLAFFLSLAPAFADNSLSCNFRLAAALEPFPLVQLLEKERANLHRSTLGFAGGLVEKNGLNELATWREIVSRLYQFQKGFIRELEHELNGYTLEDVGGAIDAYGSGDGRQVSQVHTSLVLRGIHIDDNYGSAERAMAEIRKFLQTSASLAPERRHPFILARSFAQLIYGPQWPTAANRFKSLNDYQDVMSFAHIVTGGSYEDTDVPSFATIVTFVTNETRKLYLN